MSDPVNDAGVSLTGSAGTVEARVGDRFRWWDGVEWEIASFPGGNSYSPSGLGGCPTVTCRHIAGKLDPVTWKYTVDGLCDWCGDSVASALIRTQPEANTNA